MLNHIFYQFSDKKRSFNNNYNTKSLFEINNIIKVLTEI